MISQLALTILNGFIFLISVTFFIYLPGYFLINKFFKGINSFETISLSLLSGIFIIIFNGVVFGFLGLRFLNLIALSILALLAIKKYKLKPLLEFKNLIKDKWLLIIFILGIALQGLINFPSGFLYKEGLLFWSSQGHDGLWHVALMEEIKRTFPPQNPLFYGHPLQNYHFASDLFMGEFYRIFNFFNPLDLYFRYYPILFSFMIGISSFSFALRKWGRKTAYWSTFFVYMAGGFGFIYLLLKGQFPLGGETLFWASQSNTILGNPPHTLGIIILSNILILLGLLEKSVKKPYLILIAIFGLALAVFKVSSGAVLVAGLLGMGLFELIFKRNLIYLSLGIFLGLTNFLFLKLISPNAESFLIFLPLWFPRTMMVARLENVDWELRRQHYIWVGGIKGFLRQLSLEAQAIIIFFLGNTGSRIIGLIGIFKQIKNIKLSDTFMFSGMIASLGVIFLFVQKGITFNLIQFMQIYFHFLAFYAGFSVYLVLKAIKSQKLKYIIATSFIAITIPTSVGNLFEFYGSPPNAIISNNEIEGFNWLKTNTPKNSLILTKPFQGNSQYLYNSHPYPIYAWYSTPYVTIFSERSTYLSGEEQLEITGYNYLPEREKLNKFFYEDNFSYNKELLKKLGIDYIYLHKDELKIPDMFELEEAENNLKLVFENNDSLIYEVLTK
jgi:hypothetical protein